MHAVLERLNNIATHPDLNMARHLEDAESDLEKEAYWTEYSSFKYVLLSYIIEYASDSDMHFIIMVQGGKSRQILERYLLGKGFAYTNARKTAGGVGSNVEVSLQKESLSFGIRSTQDAGTGEAYKRPSVLIAFDSTLNVKSPSVEHFRTTYARDGNLLPVIHLLISKSSEHIVRCFSGLSEHERLHLVIGCVFRYRDVVGETQESLEVNEIAEEIVGWLLSDNLLASWPIPAIESLQISGPSGHSSSNAQRPDDLRSPQKRPSVSFLQSF